MASIVRKKQTGAVTLNSLSITAPAPGNTLIAFANQASSTPSVGPTVSDNLGEYFWPANATRVLYNTSGNSLTVHTKVATGNETEISLNHSGVGSEKGIAYFECAGLSTIVDSIVHKDNIASAATATSEPITTTGIGDIVFAAVGLASNSGTITAWTGTGPMSNIETTNSFIIGGSYIPAALLSAATFTANWTTARASGLLVVAFKEVAGASGYPGRSPSMFGPAKRFETYRPSAEISEGPTLII